MKGDTMQSTKCGTYAGAISHYKNKEELCTDCRKAHQDYRKSYYQENKQKAIEYAKSQNEANPEKYRARMKSWREANYEKYIAGIKKWNQNNPEKVKENARSGDRRRRAILNNSLHEKYSDQEVLKRYGIKCHICKQAIDLDAPRSTHVKGWEKGLHIDHVIPISKGGSDTLDNVRPAHGLCNIKKKNKTEGK